MQPRPRMQGPRLPSKPLQNQKQVWVPPTGAGMTRAWVIVGLAQLCPSSALRAPSPRQERGEGNSGAGYFSSCRGGWPFSFMVRTGASPWTRTTKEISSLSLVPSSSFEATLPSFRGLLLGKNPESSCVSIQDYFRCPCAASNVSFWMPGFGRRSQPLDDERGKSGATGRVSAFGGKGLRNRKVQQFTQFISGAGFRVKQG
jgi:hypothetical protein